jgi:outer membrane receptor protein involved in Fe transport
VAGGNVTVTPPNLFFSGGPLATTTIDTSVKQLNGYLYTYLRPHPSVDLTVGVSADRYEDFTVTRDQINPKLGLTWAATPSTLLRAAWFRTLKRALVADQTLEPTQVAGFNQFFDDINGTDARRLGIGIDQRFGATVFAGLEGSLRQLTVPFGAEEQQRERLWRAYGGWMPSERFTLTAQLGVETVSAEPPQAALNRPLQLRTVRAPIEARWFVNERWSASARIQGVWQETVSEDSTRTRTAIDERFTLVDLSLSYRLPARKGIVSLEVLNLFDQQFVYQDPYFRSSVPRLPEFLPERTVYLKINLLLP